MHRIATCMQMMSVIFVFVRVVDGCRTKNILSLRTAVVVKCIFLLFWCALVLTFGLGIQFFFLLGVFLFMPMYVLFCQRKRRRLLRKDVYELLQTLILRLGAGESLHSALLSTQNSCGRDLQLFLANQRLELMDRGLFQVQQELNEIKKHLHQALLRLRWLREAWETEEQFAQKRMRATSRIRAQAGLLCVLYIGLLLFTTNRYDYFTIQNYLNVSFLFFITGIIALLVLGRSFRWKV